MEEKCAHSKTIVVEAFIVTILKEVEVIVKMEVKKFQFKFRH